MLLMFTLIIFIFCSVALLLYTSGDHYFSGFFKMFASTGFIVLCVYMGGIQSRYGLAILTGLFFSWWGDLFLISKSSAIFMVGLVAFFLAHVVYCAAFFYVGAALLEIMIAAGLLLIPAAILVHWLYPYLGSMRWPVFAYIAVISLMTAVAASAAYSSGRYLIILGAICFYCSDIFVARERFVVEQKTNQRVGLPLYYLAQILLAITVDYAR
ncbi:MAG: lysoplasmalogenase [Candidatus Hydrogenedentales bacterium]|jgi:uncharacterized membrane protein YhhN